ncbi:hypothetical protein Bca4012_029037 [Brassica carinata]
MDLAHEALLHSISILYKTDWSSHNHPSVSQISKGQHFTKHYEGKRFLPWTNLRDPSRETTWPERSKRLQQRSQLPVSQLFVSPGVYSIIVFTLGFKTGCNPTAIVEGINNTWIKLPPFSSKVDHLKPVNKPKTILNQHEPIPDSVRKEVMDDKKNGKAVWVPVSTRVEDHVVVPDLDYSNIENPDEFIEDYTSHLANNPMDMSRPLWEFHVLNIKTSNAESFGTGKFHHSLGNGMSLMSLLYASSRKTSDPDAFPTTATTRKHVESKNLWWDIKTLLVGKFGDKIQSRKVIHRIISLDDVKFVKNTMNVYFRIDHMLNNRSIRKKMVDLLGLVLMIILARAQDMTSNKMNTKNALPACCIGSKGSTLGR